MLDSAHGVELRRMGTSTGDHGVYNLYSRVCHRLSCHTIRSAKGRYYATVASWEEAIELGLKPCENCRPFFLPTGQPLRTCRVFFTDTEGVTHSVRVDAVSSLFEAAALGLTEFRRCAMMDATPDPDPATRLTVIVESPGTAHEIPMQKLSAWLESGGRNPAEQATKVRLRVLLGHQDPA